MAKIAVLVPYQGMCETAERMLGQYPRIEPMTVEYVNSERASARAWELETQGCELIIARGLQASLIKNAVKVPLVELRVTAQELAELVLEVKAELNVSRPRIALIGFENMLCDTSRFDRLFDVELHRYLVDTKRDTEAALMAAVYQAMDAGCQAVLGGEIACDKAKRLGLVYRFIPSGIESLKSALDMANHICYALDLENRNQAEINIMLNATHSGIVQTDDKGTVLRANQISFELLNCLPEDMLGKNLLKVFPSLSRDVLDRALRDGEETYAVLVPLNRREVMVSIAPVTVGQRIRGAILTLQEGRRIIEMSSELRQDMYRHGYLARFRFDMIPCEDAQTKKNLQQCERLARFDAPVLIHGENGVGKNLIAQCIHNASFAKDNAYIALDCSAYHPDTLDTMLFGNYTTRKDTPMSMVEIAQGGTLYLSHIEALSLEMQYKLQQLTRGLFLHNGSNLPVSCAVRVIVSTQVDLIARVERGEFRNDLYYALNALNVNVRPLRQKREDIPGWTRFFLNQWQSRYKRTVRLTQPAQTFLSHYDWPGNLNQLSMLCERIVLLAEHRNVDEAFLVRQIQSLAPKILPGTERAVVYKDEKAGELEALLEKYHGNRQAVAQALGISKTTLWRHIQKYGIDTKTGK